MRVEETAQLLQKRASIHRQGHGHDRAMSSVELMQPVQMYPWQHVYLEGLRSKVLKPIPGHVLWKIRLNC
jgi:hypothetical protein